MKPAPVPTKDEIIQALKQQLKNTDVVLSRILSDRADLLEASKGILELIDDEIIVRNISKDHESTWVIDALKVARIVQCLTKAIANAERDQ